LLDELRDLGAQDVRAVTDKVLPLSELDPGCCTIGWTMRLPRTVTKAEIEEVFLFAEASWSLDAADDPRPVDPMAAPPAAIVPAPPVTPLTTPAEVPPAPTPAAPAEAPRRTAAAPGATLRVPTERLDAMLDAVGELVIVEARLSELARQSRDPMLLATAEQITRLANGLRDTTMTLRLVPMTSLVARFRRLVLDVSGKIGKPVDFLVEGEDTELDKTVIDKIADPIMHILRNALDHGLETPEDRVAAGKAAKGRITLSAVHAGAEVRITIRDDGRGMDAERLRQRAISRGLITAEAVLTQRQCLDLIFAPGFSTAETVTDLSGRGVGMDVVRRTVEGLRGTIELTSEVGQGSCVTLRLPLTLAIVEGLLVETGGERYTIPLSAVQEIVALPAGHCDRTDRTRDHLDIRGRFVPFLRLRDLLECPGTDPEDPTVVVVASGGAGVGLVVDRIVGTHQTVIKQMTALHSGVRTIAGATILGDGSVALILDALHLVTLGASLSESIQTGDAA
jgi:two-component system chemotaxis sensor kinase CheA